MTISGHFFANKYLSQNFGLNSHFEAPNRYKYIFQKTVSALGINLNWF